MSLFTGDTCVALRGKDHHVLTSQVIENSKDKVQEVSSVVTKSSDFICLTKSKGYS